MKDFNVIKKAKEDLTNSLAYHAKGYAEDKLKGYSAEYNKKKLLTTKFLLNLVEAYEPNIEPYITKEEEVTE